MRVLIVENNPQLARLWGEHLSRFGLGVDHAFCSEMALEMLADQEYSVIVLNLELPDDAAMSVADYANYRRPSARVVFVTSTSFFSDGSIFSHSPNARAFLAKSTPPGDLASMVEYYAVH